MLRYVKAFAPATVANVSCGFDIFGFAVNEPGDIVEISRAGKPGVFINEIIGDGGKLPKTADENTAGVVVLEFLRQFAPEQGVNLSLHKQMPLGSGMGSSAASAAAALFAVNHLLGKPASDRQLLEIAVLGEKAACGSAHADNVAPSLIGGFTLIRAYNPLDVVKLPVPQNLWCSLVHPHVVINTRDARAVLPKQVELSTAVRQWGNTAGVVAALYANDMDLLKRAMQDHIVEPVRSSLIPYFNEVKETAVARGAIGCSISGSGPSIFALSSDEETANSISRSMQEIFLKNNLECDAFTSRVNARGPRILAEE